MRKYFLLPFLATSIFSISPTYSQTIVDNTYVNTRFHYTFVLPKGFGKPFEADNGDGITLKAKNGKAELRVWGNYIILTDSFRSEAQMRANWDKDDHWHIDSADINDDHAIWYATRGDQKLYNYTIPYCDSGMATIYLLYDISEQKHYAALIPILIKSLKIPTSTCQ